MSFYLRKSLRAGPFRVNLSSRGIGMSVGVPGFRVGTGPRGNYVHLGKRGVHYRATLGGAGGSRPSPTPARRVDERPAWLPRGAQLDPSGVVLVDVTGSTTVELANVPGSDILEQLQAARKRHPLWPWFLTLVVCLALAVPVLAPVVLVLGALATWWVRQRDIARRSVVVFYDVNDDSAVRFQALIDGFELARQCQGAWQQNAEGKVTTTYQHKVNAGASRLVSRAKATLTTRGPSNLVTNIMVPTIEAAGRSVHLLPDRVFICHGRTVAEESWPSLTTSVARSRFIEDEAVPSDAPLVGTTWKYVNVGGGPDRRYKANRQLPILEYGHVEIASPSGFRAEWQFSNPSSAEAFAVVLDAMR